MFLSYIGLALMFKRLESRLSLGWLFLASLWLDLVCGLFSMADIEIIEPDPELAGVFPVSFKSIPYSHSLAAAVFWAVVLAAVVYYVRRPKGLGVLYIGVLVVSHWFFDLLFHRADLPLLPWDKGVYGYGLWGSFGATVGISVLIFCIGLFFYWQAARQANSRIGRVFWCVMIALVGIFLGDAMVTPALIDDVVTGFLLLWLLVPLGKWVDFTRPDAYVAIR